MTWGGVSHHNFRTGSKYLMGALHHNFKRLLRNWLEAKEYMYSFFSVLAQIIPLLLSSILGKILFLASHRFPKILILSKSLHFLFSFNLNYYLFSNFYYISILYLKLLNIFKVISLICKNQALEGNYEKKSGHIVLRLTNTYCWEQLSIL